MDTKLNVALDEIRKEYLSAIQKFGDFQCVHEGYAVILEELDELWELIKTNGDATLQRKEARQVATMAIRFMLDLCD